MKAASGSESTVRAGETGLEKPLRRLGLGGGPESYPERPDKADCSYYLRTGYCVYGNLCRFNHPRDRTMVMGAMRASGGDFQERLGQPVCQGEKECSYYVKTGQCKFGVTCEIRHPQPADVQVAAPVSGPAPLCPAASASTQPNVGAPPIYGASASTQPNVGAPPVYGASAISQPNVGAPPDYGASASTQPNVGAPPVYCTGQYVPVSSFPAPSGSSSMSDYFSDLPQKVFSDILIRLPLKSIGRSRCVSKPWLSLLTSYEFMKAYTHLAQEPKLLLISESSLFSLSLHLGGNHLRELGFFNEQVIDLVGSCNGLVLVMTKGRTMWLINCMTKEYVKVPDSPSSPICPHRSFKKYGFGYDELQDDYKIVKILKCDYSQFANALPNCVDVVADIYSLKMRSWKRSWLPIDDHDPLCHDSCKCVFFNGAVHWRGLNYKYTKRRSAVIGAFDLSHEKFTDFEAPYGSFNQYSRYATAMLMVIDGCLGMVITPESPFEKTKIWLMKSYPLADSWMEIDIGYRPVCFHVDKIFYHFRHVCFHEDKIIYHSGARVLK